MLRLSPLIAPLLNYFARHDSEKLVREQAQKERGRLVQVEPHSVLVDSFNAEILGLYRNELFARHRGFQLWICLKTLHARLHIARQCQSQRRVHLMMESRVRKR